MVLEPPWPQPGKPGISLLWLGCFILVLPLKPIDRIHDPGYTWMAMLRSVCSCGTCQPCKAGRWFYIFPSSGGFGGQSHPGQPELQLLGREFGGILLSGEGQSSSDDEGWAALSLLQSLWPPL